MKTTKLRKPSIPLCLIVSFLAAGLSSCTAPSPSPAPPAASAPRQSSDPVALASRLLAQWTERQMNAARNSDGATVTSPRIARRIRERQRVQLLTLQNIDRWGYSDEAFIAVFCVGWDRHLYILDPVRPCSQTPSTDEPCEYAVAAHAVLQGDLIIHDAPETLDADSNEMQDVLVRFGFSAADRSPSGFLLFSRQNGSWKIFTSPILVPVVREQLPGVRLYVEDLNQSAQFEGQSHFMQPIGIGDWQVRWKHDGTRSFLGFVALDQGECTMCPHRYAVVVYRFTPAGFELDPDWNGGKAFITPDPVTDLGPATLDRWYEQGFKTQAQ
jgi:hypothetical protein